MKIKLPKIILAPLSGITSLPFRTINREAGCKFAFLEMLSATSLGYRSGKTLEMMKTGKNDRPLGVQLLADDAASIEKAMAQLEDYVYDILDLNAACPQKKVTSHGKGAALLKDPKKLKNLLTVFVKHAKVPVTVKLRLGWDSDKEAVNIAKTAEDAGVSAVCVHGRTKEQGYRGEINYVAIRGIKKALKIPVIGSGNIWGGEMAKKMFDETCCDAITVARGALGNPWIFKEIEEYLRSGRVIPGPSIKEVAKMMRRHLNMAVDFYGDNIGVLRFRKFYAWYTGGFSKTRLLRSEVFSAANPSEIMKLIDKFELGVGDDKEL